MTIDDIHVKIVGVIGLSVAALASFILTKLHQKLYEHVMVNIVPSLRAFSILSLRRNNTCNAAIRQYLAELRVLTGADRATLTNLHNGNKDAAGIGFRKFTIVHEITANGVAGAQQYTKDLDIASYPELVAAITAKDPIVLLCVNDLNQCSAAFGYAMERGIHCGLMLCTITVKRFGIDKLYGFVAISFTHAACAGNAAGCPRLSKDSAVELRRITALIKTKIGQRI